MKKLAVLFLASALSLASLTASEVASDAKVLAWQNAVKKKLEQAPTRITTPDAERAKWVQQTAVAMKLEFAVNKTDNVFHINVTGKKAGPIASRP